MISLRNACLVILALALPGVVRGQDRPTVFVSVVDDVGMPIPYALVKAGSRVTRVADEAGVAMLNITARDSLRLQVRRIGFREFYGWVRTAADGRFVVPLSALPSTLATVDITERANTPLARTGFYDRMERVRRGAIVGEFITPEELDERSYGRVSDMLRGRMHARVAGGRGPTAILGRGGCGMNIVVDGKFVRTIEQTIVGEAPTSISPMGTRSRGGPGVDQLVNGLSVMAIEIYPSGANAPAEIIPISGRGSCGIVAIWTGGRH